MPEERRTGKRRKIFQQENWWGQRGGTSVSQMAGGGSQSCYLVALVFLFSSDLGSKVVRRQGRWGEMYHAERLRTETGFGRAVGGGVGGDRLRRP